MPAEIAADRLAELVTRMLEDAAFIFTEPSDPAPPFPTPVLEARLTFDGPGSGELALTTTPALAQGLAANLLGLEPGDPETGRRAGDALGEFVNMLAGVVVLELFGPKAQTRIGVPEVRELAAAAASLGATCASLATEDGERIDARVSPSPQKAP